jgi:uncharacterized protein
MTADPLADQSRPGLLVSHLLAGYLVLAYGLTWMILVPAGLGLIPEAAGGILSLVAPFGPAVAAFIMTAVLGGRPAMAQLVGRLGQWRVGVGWYALVLFGIPIIELLGAFALLGSVPLDDLVQNWPVIFGRYLPNVLFVSLLTGLGEEPGWRGFALPRLQQRHGPLAGTGVLAIVWAMWHLPNLMFGGWTGLSYGLWLVLTVASAFIYTWVYNHTGGSVLLAVLLHGAMDAGQFATLSEVLDHYNTAPAAPEGHSELKPLNLTDTERGQVEMFLRSLSSPLATPPALLEAPTTSAPGR